MSKKRAFVRYTKSGDIVPGSLILTNGSYPDKPALWKEVITNKCCDNSGGGGTTRLVGTFNPFSDFFFVMYADNIFTFTANDYTGTTPTEWLTYFNLHFGWMGTFSSNPENPEGSVFFDINTEIFNSLDNPNTFVVFSVGAV